MHTLNDQAIVILFIDLRVTCVTHSTRPGVGEDHPSARVAFLLLYSDEVHQDRGVGESRNVVLT